MRCRCLSAVRSRTLPRMDKFHVPMEEELMAGKWIVVANRAVAQIYKLDRETAQLVAVECLSHPEGRLHNRDLGADRPGRAFDSFGKSRHAMGASVSEKEHSTEVFAREIAHRLERGRMERAFESLVLVAEPRFLGRLQGMLQGELSHLVTGTVAKDLVDCEPLELFQRIAPAVRPSSIGHAKKLRA